MATKAEMLEEIIEFFDTYGRDLEVCGIKTRTAYRWVEHPSLSYHDLQQIYKFIFSDLLKKIGTMRFCESKFDEPTWRALVAAAPALAEWQELKLVRKHIQQTWKERPCRI